MMRFNCIYSSPIKSKHSFRTKPTRSLIYWTYSAFITNKKSTASIVFCGCWLECDVLEFSLLAVHYSRWLFIVHWKQAIAIKDPQAVLVSQKWELERGNPQAQHCKVINNRRDVAILSKQVCLLLLVPHF